MAAMTPPGSVVVPSIDGQQIIFPPGVFGSSQSFSVASAIANFLNGLPLANPDPSLNVQLYTPPTTPAAISGDVNELVIPASLSGGTVSVPAGYNWVADSTGGGALTVDGAQNFIGSNGALTVFNTSVPAASGIDSIAAGNGADLFGLVAGSTYNVAAGNGSDTYFGNGSGTMAGGTGSNQFFATGGPNLVLSFGHDTVAVGTGAATVATYGSGPLIFGGSGNLEVFGNSATSETLVGGSGPETIFGAQSGVYFLGSSTSLFVGNNASNSTIVGSTVSSAQETVLGGVSSNETIFSNSSSLQFVSSSGDSTTIVGGSSPSTLFGSSGSAITYFSAASGGGALYSAGTGNETLNAAGSNTNDTIFAGADSTSGNSLVGGTGNDTFTAGSGSDTMVGGAGSNSFFFTDGSVGGNDFIVGYNANDEVGLFGYGIAAGAKALATATVSGGSTTIALSDNTKITFEGVSSPSSIHITST